MDVSKLKVGDKVRIRSWEDLKNEFGLTRSGNINTKVWVLAGSMEACCGQVYTIRSIKKHDDYYSLDFKETCFIFSDDSIEPVNKNNSIVIYQKGGEVVALDKSTGKTVRCGAYDDFYKGADAAFKKLIKKNSKPDPKPKKYNGEVVCVVAATDLFTVGKVYKVTDGYLINDAGVKEGEFADFDSLNRRLVSEFIKVIK